MRKGLFAVVVVAAFAGGAVISGPDKVFALLRPKVPSDQGPALPLADGAARALESPASDPPIATDPPVPEPTADDAPPELPPKKQAKTKAARPTSDPGVARAAVEVTEPPAPVVAAADTALEPPKPDPAEAPEPGPAPLAPPVVGSKGTGDAPHDLPEPPATAPKSKTPGPARPEKADGAPAPDGGAAHLKDWPDVRRRMRELGVTRYWVEGEPGGRSRFRCLVPDSGARSVGRHFEAEGDDDLQAADAALRRVALWKATAPD